MTEITLNGTSNKSPRPNPAEIVKSFRKKLKQQEQDSLKPKKIRIFVSYSWRMKKDSVQSFATRLEEVADFSVSIDTTLMGEANAENFKKAAQAIDDADVVLVFFSSPYAENENCRRELEYAVSKEKVIIPIRVERGYRPEGWLLFIFKSQRRYDLFDNENGEQFYDMICDLIRNANHTDNPTDTTSVENYKIPWPFFHSSGVPFSPKFRYFSRNKEEEHILAIIQSISKTPFDGCLILSGDGGVGKTMIMANLLSEESSRIFLESKCSINRVIWINCFEWRQHFTEKAFNDKVLELAKQIEPYDNGASFPSIPSISDYYLQKGAKVMLVLDDLYNFQVIRFLFDKFSGTKSIPLIVGLTRDAENIVEHESALVQKIDRIEEMSPLVIRDMLKSTYKLGQFLVDEQLLKLATSLCYGLPLIASLVAARIAFNSSAAVAEYKLLTSLAKTLGLLTKERPFNIVSNLFSISLGQIDSSIRSLYYTFLFFNPSEPVSVLDLGILWQFDLQDDDFRFGVRAICQAFEKLSLVRLIKRKLPLSQNSEEGDEDEDENEDKYLVHQMLFESAIVKVARDLNFGDYTTYDEVLARLRSQLILGRVAKRRGGDNRFSAKGDDDDDLRVVINALKYRRFDLLRRAIDEIDLPTLLSLCQMRSKQLTNDDPFIFHLYNFDWEGYEDSEKQKTSFRFQKHSSYRLTKKIIDRIIKQGDFVKVITSQQRRPPLSSLLISVLDRLKDPIADHAALASTLLPWKSEYEEQKWKRDLFQLGHPDDLMKATGKNDVASVKDLLISDRSRWDCQGALRAACRLGFVNVAKLILEGYEDLAKARDDEGLNSMILAAMNGHLEVVKFLHKIDASLLKTVDNQQISAFDYACKNGRIECAKFILEKSPSAMLNSKIYGAMMIVAASIGSLDVCKFIFDYSPELIRKKDPASEATALAFAARGGHLETMKFLLEKDDDLLNIGKAFLMAANEGQLEAVRILLKKYPEVAEYRDAILQGSALTIAANNGHFDVVEYLFGKCKSSAEIHSQHGFAIVSALAMAASCGHLDIVRFLYFKEPYNVKSKFTTGESCIEVARRMGNDEVVEFLEESLRNNNKVN